MVRLATGIIVYYLLRQWYSSAFLMAFMTLGALVSRKTFLQIFKLHTNQNLRIASCHWFCTSSAYRPFDFVGNSHVDTFLSCSQIRPLTNSVVGRPLRYSKMALTVSRGFEIKDGGLICCTLWCCTIGATRWWCYSSMTLEAPRPRSSTCMGGPNWPACGDQIDHRTMADLIKQIPSNTTKHKTTKHEHLPFTDRFQPISRHKKHTSLKGFFRNVQQQVLCAGQALRVSEKHWE